MSVTNIANAQEALINKKQLLAHLPMQNCMGIEAQANEEAIEEVTHRVLQQISSTYQAVSACLQNPLTPQEAAQLVRGSLRESTINALAELSFNLENCGSNYADHAMPSSLDKKAVCLRNFMDFLENLEQVDRIEAIKVMCLELSEMHRHLHPNKRAYANHDTKEGLRILVQKVWGGKVCINDSFRPVLKAVFGNLHIVSLPAS